MASTGAVTGQRLTLILCTLPILIIKGDVEMNKNKEEGSSKKDIVCSILLLLWFAGSLVAGDYCDKNGHESLCISLFGQVFLLIGIYGCCHFKDPRKNMLFFIIPYITTKCKGIICIICTKNHDFSGSIPMFFIGFL